MFELDGGRRRSHEVGAISLPVQPVVSRPRTKRGLAPVELHDWGFTELELSLRGAFRKCVLVDAEGRRCLFKYDTPETRADVAIAYARVARLVGVDTPGIRRARWQGALGSVQEWRTAPALVEVRADGTHAQMLQSPEYLESVSAMTVLDAVVAYYDRHEGNVLVDPEGHAIAIDNDWAFYPQGIAELYEPLTPRSEAVLATLVREAPHIENILAPYLGPELMQEYKERLGYVQRWARHPIVHPRYF